MAAVTCHGGGGAGAMLLMREAYASQLLYDVSDPIRPRLLCKISNTSAHLLTGDTFEYLKPISATETDVMIRSLGSGNESIAGKFPFRVDYEPWLPDLSVAAYTTLDPQGSVQVWLYSQRQSTLLFTYQVGGRGCICRFGVPQQVLALSPDGQYLAAGRDRGPEPLTVYRVADRTLVTTFAASLAIWGSAGHRLFLGLQPNSEQSWTPEAGITTVRGADSWPYRPGWSPDGGQVAYTSYPDPALTSQPRVYVYDLNAAAKRMLQDKPRAQALFVKMGMLWYLEERPCDQCGQIQVTQPTGKVFAMQLSASTESEVSFAAGENPLNQDRIDTITWPSFAPGEFWPAT
jgi:hypothetical protein